MKIRTQQGETIDAICWRVYGRTTGITEKVLLVNPGLSDFGSVLPVGLLIDMPDVIDDPVKKLIQLWD